MPQLDTLKITTPGLELRHISNCRSVLLPPEPFPMLKALEVTEVDSAAEMYLWLTPIVPRLIKLSIYGGTNWDILGLFNSWSGESGFVPT
jgi:hypothetical protein